MAFSQFFGANDTFHPPQNQESNELYLWFHLNTYNLYNQAREPKGDRSTARRRVKDGK